MAKSHIFRSHREWIAWTCSTIWTAWIPSRFWTAATWPTGCGPTRPASRPRPLPRRPCTRLATHLSPTPTWRTWPVRAASWWTPITWCPCILFSISKWRACRWTRATPTRPSTPKTPRTPRCRLHPCSPTGSSSKSITNSLRFNRDRPSPWGCCPRCHPQCSR